MRNLFLISISAFLFLCGLASPESVHGQFIHFQMSVEPELSADVVQDLDFGEFVTNSGIQRIKQGSPYMGIFEIRSLQNQHIAVTLSPPDALTHSNPDTNEEIPVTLKASFTDGSVQDVKEAQPFTGTKAWFTIGDQANSSLETEVWESAFVYIYGSLNIGDVTDGTYDAMLVLTVEYQ